MYSSLNSYSVLVQCIVIKLQEPAVSEVAARMASLVVKLVSYIHDYIHYIRICIC